MPFFLGIGIITPFATLKAFSLSAIVPAWGEGSGKSHDMHLFFFFSCHQLQEGEQKRQGPLDLPPHVVLAVITFCNTQKIV